MPRQSITDYIQAHQHLANVWRTNRQDFSALSYSQQRQLHDYFRPSEHLTDAELLMHRQQVSSQHPSLPAAAGRALATLNRSLQALRQPAQPILIGKDRRLVISSVARPEPDLHRLSRAFMLLAKTRAAAGQVADSQSSRQSSESASGDQQVA